MTAHLDDHYQKGFIASDPELDPKPQIRIVNIKKMIEEVVDEVRIRYIEKKQKFIIYHSIKMTYLHLLILTLFLFFAFL